MFHALMGRFQLEFVYYFSYFSTVFLSNSCVFLSCRPFIVNTTFSTIKNFSKQQKKKWITSSIRKSREWLRFLGDVKKHKNVTDSFKNFNHKYRKMYNQVIIIIQARKLYNEPYINQSSKDKMNPYLPSFLPFPFLTCFAILPTSFGEKEPHLM